MSLAMTKNQTDSPFELANAKAYTEWRAWKLDSMTMDAEQLSVAVENPLALQAAEQKKITDLAATHNMVIFQVADTAFTSKELVHEIGKSIGLSHLDNNLRADEDSVTSLEVREQQGNQYIPYTNKPLSWHTDGYYNRLDRQVRGIIMYCVQPAANGGVNALIDHELMYIRLRDTDPAFIDALQHQQAMTIPANTENGVELRPAQAGPVFSPDPNNGRLHMRYSARQRNIEWRDTAETMSAKQAITELLQDESITCRVKLQAGQGIICNNVLHNRTAFEDTAEQKRLMYRARYYDRIYDGLDEVLGESQAES